MASQAQIDAYRASGGQGDTPEGYRVDLANMQGGAQTGQIMPSMQPSFNLQEIYDRSMNSPEVQALKKQLADADMEYQGKEKEFASVKGTLTNNPFYSQAMLTGKLSKLEQQKAEQLNLINNRKARIADSLNTMNADAQTRINLATKQYDIQRQEYQDNVSRFNMLLSSGAINDANMGEIAPLASSIGMTTSQVGSMLAKMRQDNIKPQIFQSDDGNGNLNLTVVDANTGNVIKSNTLKGQGSKSSPNKTNTPKTGLDALSPVQLRTYVGGALKILNQEDTSTHKSQTMPELHGTIKEDKYLSGEEANRALEKVRQLVGDNALAEDIFWQAWSNGGYKEWTGK